MADYDAPRENPYRSPLAEARPETPPRFRPLAVFVGWLVDEAVSIAGGIAIGILYVIIGIAGGARPEHIQAMIAASEPVQLAGLALGVASTALGGYVAAWMGRVFPLRHAFALGIVSLCSGLIWRALFPKSMSLGHGLVCVVITVPAALLGGNVRARQSQAALRRGF